MPNRPKILAPAGDWPSLRAALASGADSVYFGLADGFNARARAQNLSSEDLPKAVELCHRAGARAFLTLNTLIFESELHLVESSIRHAARCGVDALIIQDPAVVLLAAEICKTLELHASTQMTISSPDAARFAADLGITRVVVPRELSVDEIRRFAEGTELELEAFVHGALCVSWSGQCLSSEVWGGRSANRGQCAQACRLPYELIVDGEHRDLQEITYLLSPKDLAGVAAVPALAEIGVHTLKIEGRLKGPAYVHATVGGYRRWVDSIAEGTPDRERLSEDVAAMEVAYSRGFSPGFLAGSNHQSTVEGRFPKHRGVYLGRVVSVSKTGVELGDEREGRPWTGALGLGGERPAEPSGKLAVELPELPAKAIEPRAGMGVVFDAGRPEESEIGAAIFDVEALPSGWRIDFGRRSPKLTSIRAGDRVWLNSDAQIARAGDKAAEREIVAKREVALAVSGALGEPMKVRARRGQGEIEVSSAMMLEASRSRGLDDALLSDKLGATGDTAYAVGSIDSSNLDDGLFLPVSEVKALRRRYCEALDTLSEPAAAREVSEETVSHALRARFTPVARNEGTELVVLCRQPEHLEAALEAGVTEVELDWMEMVGLSKAVARARDAGVRVTVATLRVQKPGEEGYDKRIAKLDPDGVLVRHWGGMVHFRDRAAVGARPIVHGDFSLNVTNSITANLLLESGLETITCAHDLDAVQLWAMLEHVPASRVAVTIHHHVATFHTEHCVFAHTLSNGRDYRSCGRPCEAHEMALRDRVGLEHPVIVDVGCRNTVFNAQAQSAASLVPKLLERGVRRLRIELVRESRDEASAVISAYSELIAGRIAPRECLRRAGGHEQFGLTRGTMRVLS